MIHIEGMGVLGMQVAWELEALGVDFTWSDIEAEYTAWHCSTGIVYPSGSDRDMEGLAWWLAAAQEGRFGALVAATPYVFAHKNPPHGGRYKYRELLDADVRMAEPPAVAVNVPALVRRERERLAAYRTDGRKPGELLVRAHSNTDRLDGYLWGWTSRVTFDGPLEEVATYYAKKHRFNLTYAYPIPGDGQWWAGSILKFQAEPKRLPDSALQRFTDMWIADAEELLGLSNIQVHSLEQGWRPRRGGMDVPNVSRQVGDGEYELAPEPTSGVRHGPLIVSELMDRIGL